MICKRVLLLAMYTVSAGSNDVSADGAPVKRISGGDGVEKVVLPLDGKMQLRVELKKAV